MLLTRPGTVRQGLRDDSAIARALRRRFAQVGQLNSRFIGQRVLRIQLQKFLKGSTRTLAVIQVAQIDLALGQQRTETVATARILLAEKLVLRDRIVQRLLI